ncbi:MAG: hypothetical protein ABR927_08090 [Bacteroidales bacterium]
MVHFNYPFGNYDSFKQLIRISISTLSVCLILNSNVRSQDNHKYTYGFEPEKIYMQLDGKVYTTDKTIWFKAIVTNASDHNLTKLSGVLYVELIGPDEKIIEKKLIKLENGIGTGFFDLNQNYSEGTYLIRAYTEWDRNFGTDFFFNEYIQVFAPTAKMKPEPISNVTLVEKKDKKRQLIAYFDPFVIDSLHKKELTLIITHDKIIDTLSLKKDDDNKFRIDYDIPDNCQFVTLKMVTKNLFSFTKTIVLDEDHLDLQFFPESGELVHGIRSRVGFKALEYNGKGKSVTGEIINGKGEVLTRFKSNKLGMGSFIFNNPDKDSACFARLKSQSDSNLSNIYPLPKVSPQGNVLSVIRSGDAIHITASSSYLKNDSIYIKVSCRGLVYYEIKGKLKDGVLSFSLPVNKLPDGIIAFTMMDNTGHPVAERLAFNERSDSRLNIEISTDKVTYIQRELTKLKIKTTDNHSEPVATSLSLLVLNKEQMGQIQNTRQNILSYFLLSSDLKGEIENPGFYFSNNKSYDDIDALMLTQGWRRYLYNKSVDTVTFKPESRLNLSGSVSGILFQKKKKAAEITVMTFGRRKAVQTLTTDSLGRFYFDLNDEYGQNLNILIQSANHAGRNKDYKIVLDKKESPKITFDHIPSIGKVDSVIKKLVENNIERKKVDETYKLSGGILLGEVKVEAYRMTPARKKVMQEYGKPNEVISGETIQEKEEKWSFGLYSVLQSKFPDKVHIFRISDGELLAEVRKTAPTLVVVDGSAVNHDDYGSIAYIPPSEVSSFEIIEDVSNRSKVWFEFCPECNPLSIPKTIDVIAIYTYGGSGIYGVHKPEGIIKASVPVFSTPREFYTPKYANLQPGDWYKPDLRALIDWEPKLIADSLGKASTTFYNADVPGNMQVVVEAISNDGKIGYQELTYNVRKRELNK